MMMHVVFAGNSLLACYAKLRYDANGAFGGRTGLPTCGNKRIDEYSEKV
jgi:hypothetical protein